MPFILVEEQVGGQVWTGVTSAPKRISLYTTSGSRCKLPIFLRRWQDGLGWGGAEGS
jgi:hypothetical protein